MIPIRAPFTAFGVFARTPGRWQHRGDMVRDLTAPTDKPETDTEAEVLAEQLKQIATVSSGIPNIMLESGEFRGFISTDLCLALSEGVETTSRPRLRPLRRHQARRGPTS